MTCPKHSARAAPSKLHSSNLFHSTTPHPYPTVSYKKIKTLEDFYKMTLAYIGTSPHPPTPNHPASGPRSNRLNGRNSNLIAVSSMLKFILGPPMAKMEGDRTTAQA